LKSGESDLLYFYQDHHKAAETLKSVEDEKYVLTATSVIPSDKTAKNLKENVFLVFYLASV
jgi:hypothetical protein